MNSENFFFIVGAQRSGTTYLYHLLDEHPEIEMARPVKPEPKFFLHDELFALGVDYYQNTFFGKKDGAKVYGEKSTSYIETEAAARRIASTFPQAKILFLLREPIQRAISNYWFSVNNGLETGPMEQAFLQEEARRDHYDTQKTSVSPFAYLKRGRYMDYIELYEHYFSRPQIRIILFEQLVASDQALRDLYTFLKVSPDFTPSRLHEKINASHKEAAPALSKDTLKVLQDYFSLPNTRLAAYLGIDLSEWGW